MVDRKRPELVAAAPKDVARPELDELALVRQAPEDAPQRPEEVVQAGRAVDRQRQLTPPERERLQHSRETEVVVGVVVRKEDLAQLDEAYRRPQQLSLSASAQSKSRRSPPLRTSSAVGARRGVGIDPDVPRNTRSKSIGRL